VNSPYPIVPLVDTGNWADVPLHLSVRSVYAVLRALRVQCR
jgi:hypothetical protein